MKYLEIGRKRSDAKRHPRVMVDDEDFDLLNQYNWSVNQQNTVFSWLGTMKDKKKPVLLHRLIMNAPNDMEIDHIDRNRLNNQKSNLRLANSSQNKCNRGPRKDNKSGYKGVSWHKTNQKWTARIMVDSKYKHLGLFKDIKDAVIAYNKASETYHGVFAFIIK